MFEGGGLAYVYFVYGMHCCFNVTAGGPGDGEAVLVRAVEPLEGLDSMMRRRGTGEVRLLASGPGRLCEAMGIGLGISGTDLTTGPVRVLVRAPGLSPGSIASSPRIGVRAAADRPWRFYVRGSPFLSRI
jgi:DNA-3-methyladenine glycosylase